MLKRILSIIVLLSSFSFAKAQEQHIFKSKNLPKADTVWVFKPKNNETKNLPLIFLLHGYSGNYKQWDGIMNAQKYADEYGFIIVCPDGLYNSWYLNSPVKKESQYETFFFEELYPKMVKKYKADTANIFITGLSMGGHGALSLFIKKPELFKSAGSTSGGVKLTDGFNKYGLSDLLGSKEKTDEVWLQNSVIGMIDRLKGSIKPFIFDCGAGDFFYQSNNELKQKCDELKLNATYVSQPGAHNKAYWAKSIKQQFEYFRNLLVDKK